MLEALTAILQRGPEFQIYDSMDSKAALVAVRVQYEDFVRKMVIPLLRSGGDTITGTVGDGNSDVKIGRMG